MPKNKTLEELRPLAPEIENLINLGKGKQSICTTLGITIADVHKFCRSLASDAALKNLEG